MKNEIINVDGTNWLVREAIDEKAALNAIVYARVSGAVGTREFLNDVLIAHVTRLTDEGIECLAYGEKGEDFSHLLPKKD